MTSARHTLQSTTSWIGGQRITDLESTHLQNILRFLLLDPLDQILSCRDAEIIASYDWFDASIWGEPDFTVQQPSTGRVAEYLAQYHARLTFDEATHVGRGDIEPTEQFPTQTEAVQYLLDTFDDGAPWPMEKIEASAREWIRQTPTFQAIQAELIERIISGDASLAINVVAVDHDINPEPF